MQQGLRQAGPRSVGRGLKFLTRRQTHPFHQAKTMRPSMPVESGERVISEERTRKSPGPVGPGTETADSLGSLSLGAPSGTEVLDRPNRVMGSDVPRLSSSVCTQETRTRNSLYSIVHNSRRRANAYAHQQSA